MFHMESEPSFAFTSYYNEVEKDLKVAGDRNLQQAAAEIRKHFPLLQPKISTRLLSGPAGKAIVDKAKKWNADLLVVGSHGYGFWGRMLGSVSDDIVHHAPCSVLVARQ
jgi:nucleotide-binding universal stress UspA family protein